MNISEYRHAFASFNSSLELLRYQSHVGLTPEVNADEIFDEHRSLFSIESISELRTLLDQTPADFGTEVRALQRLLDAVQSRQVELRNCDLTAELARCESATVIHWMGRQIGLAEVPARLASAPANQRHELGARWLDALATCDGLRLSWRDALNESARVLGFPSYYQLRLKSSWTKSHGLQQAAFLILEQTESDYRSALKNLVSRELPERRLNEFDYTDWPYLAHTVWLDEYLPSSKLVRTHSETVRGMGIRLDQQKNLELHRGAVSSKKAAVCFPVRPPFDVRLALAPDGGSAEFLRGQQQFGKAQHFAWCSKDITRRYPEFIYSSDTATADGFGYLFKYLALDLRWLLEFLPEIGGVWAGRIAKDVGLQLSLSLRTLCAAVLFDPHLYDEAQSSEQLQATYVALYERATSLSMRPELFLRNLEHGLRSECKLRGLAFSFSLREYLRVRYGHRWWGSRKAGDELIDLWSTASQYSVEELTSSIGFGELNFDLLAESIRSALGGA